MIAMTKQRYNLFTLNWIIRASRTLKTPFQTLTSLSGRLRVPGSYGLGSLRSHGALPKIQLSHLFTCKRPAFTLAEVLITLGVIGVVAAVTLPTLLTNVQERVRQEQVRTVKYKFTKATEKMNSLGLIGHYDSTMDFVNELKKHMSIAKVCDSSKLNECWGSTSFTNANASKTYTVADLKKGKDLEALQFNSGDTDTVGIVTGDGVPIILSYGKECQALDESKQYQWSTVNGKPETNATAGCVSMVFDINGPKAPNRVGTDVRTMNSILGMVELGTNYASLSLEECKRLRTKYGVNACYFDPDNWFGALKACMDLGLNLPSPETLAKVAELQYGVAGIDIYDNIVLRSDCITYKSSTRTCMQPKSDYSSPLSATFSGSYWANRAYPTASGYSMGRSFSEAESLKTYDDSASRYNKHFAVCLAD